MTGNQWFENCQSNWSSGIYVWVGKWVSRIDAVIVVSMRDVHVEMKRIEPLLYHISFNHLMYCKIHRTINFVLHFSLASTRRGDLYFSFNNLEWKSWNLIYLLFPIREIEFLGYSFPLFFHLDIYPTMRKIRNHRSEIHQTQLIPISRTTIRVFDLKSTDLN
jgi:hypothetical protein